MFSCAKRFYGFFILFTCLILFSLSCSKGGGTDVEEEPAPPRVENLSASEATPTTVRLTWTSPGDSGKSGNSVMYDVRYAAFLITEQNWSTATQANNIPGPPKLPGLTESMVVTGWTPGTIYCFGLKSKNPSDKWSLLSTVDSATTLMDDIVNFPDTALNRIIRTKIGKPSGDIHKSDLLVIQILEDSAKGIVDLTGLEACVNIQKLDLIENQITNISSLSSLIHLYWLNLKGNAISDLSPLAGLTELHRLYLVGNAVSNLAPLANLTLLDEIDLGENNITDIGPLAGLSNLSFLFAGTNNISNISAVSGMSKLFNLSLPHNQLSDLTPLASVDSIVQLNLDFNNIVDLTPLTNLVKLQWIHMDWNQIISVTPLINNPGLGTDDNIYVRFNPLPLSWTTDSTTLANRGVGVYFVRQTH